MKKALTFGAAVTLLGLAYGASFYAPSGPGGGITGPTNGVNGAGTGVAGLNGGIAGPGSSGVTPVFTSKIKPNVFASAITPNTNNSLATGLIALAWANPDGSYGNPVPTLSGGDPLLTNPTSLGKTLTAQTADNNSGYGTALKWQGQAWESLFAGWWFDPDTDGETNPIQQTMWINQQPAGTGWTIAVVFDQTGATTDNPVNLFSSGLVLDNATVGTGFTLTGSGSSYSVAAYVTVANGTPLTQQQVGSSASATQNAIHVAILTCTATSTSASSCSFYLDGVQSGATTTGLAVVNLGNGNLMTSGWQTRAGNVNTNEGQFQLGGWYHIPVNIGNFGNILNGYIFEAAMWQRGFSGADVTSFSSGPYQMLQTGVPPTNSWTPTTEGSHLLGWWKANAGVTQSSGAVTAWADQSGHGYNMASEGTAGAVQYSATSFNGTKPGLTLVPGTAVGDMIATIASLNSSSFSIFLTIQIPYGTNPPQSNGRYWAEQAVTAAHDYDNNNSMPYLTSPATEAAIAQPNFTSIAPTHGSPVLSNKAMTLGFVCNGATCSTYINGMLQPTPASWTNIFGSASGGIIRVFGSNAQYTGATIAEVAVFNDAPSNANYYAYAQRTWGVQ
jgi:hypothetical protein